jgi:hypothetical protein
MIGPGKYDAVCTVAREATKAEAAIVIIINGDKGSGFSVQGDEHATVTMENIITLLMTIAAEMRNDIERLKRP